MEKKPAITFGAEGLNRWLAARRSVDRANVDEISDRYKKDGDSRELEGQGCSVPPR